MIIILFLSIFCIEAKTIKQYEEQPKEIVKKETVYLIEDPYISSEMDMMKIVNSYPWNGKKAPIWDMKGVQYPHYQSDLLFTQEEKQEEHLVFL